MFNGKPNGEIGDHNFKKCQISVLHGLNMYNPSYVYIIYNILTTIYIYYIIYIILYYILYYIILYHIILYYIILYYIYIILYILYIIYIYYIIYIWILSTRIPLLSTFIHSISVVVTWNPNEVQIKHHIWQSWWIMSKTIVYLQYDQSQ